MMMPFHCSFRNKNELKWPWSWPSSSPQPLLVKAELRHLQRLLKAELRHLQRLLWSAEYNPYHKPLSCSLIKSSKESLDTGHRPLSLRLFQKRDQISHILLLQLLAFGVCCIIELALMPCYAAATAPRRTWAKRTFSAQSVTGNAVGFMRVSVISSEGN